MEMRIEKKYEKMTLDHNALNYKNIIFNCLPYFFY